MKIYEVFVCVPYLDPDWNEGYKRKDGVFFANKSDAEVYLNKMYNDKDTNRKLEPHSDCKKKRRYVTLSDYTETEMSWDEFCGVRGDKLSKKEVNRLTEIFRTNWLVDEMKYHNAILLAVTYGGNKWFLREVELN